MGYYSDLENHNREGEKMKTAIFVTRDREAGNVIETFGSHEDARKAINRYEADDRRDDLYTPDFYEVAEI